jgi:hypothetical protein
MGFVEDEEVVVYSRHQLSNGHSIGCEDDTSLLASLFFEPNIVANFLPNLKTHFLSNPLGECDGADSSGLGDDDFLEVRIHIFGNLGGLSTPCISADDNYWILVDCSYDLVVIFEDGQRGGTVDLKLLINHNLYN